MQFEFASIKPVLLRASSRSAYQPKSRRHIHPPQCGMRRPMAAVEIHLPRRQNKRHDDVVCLGAGETRDVFHSRLAAAPPARPRALKKTAEASRFLTAPTILSLGEIFILLL